MILGLLCLGGALGLFVVQSKELQQQATQSSSTTVHEHASVTPPRVQATANPQSASEAFTLPAFDATQNSFVTLENEAIRVHFSLLGGGIHSVELKKFTAQRDGNEPYIFNKNAGLPALTLGWDKHQSITQRFQVTHQADRFLQLHTTLEDGTILVRGYKLAASDAENPYSIQTEISIVQPKGFTSNVKADRTHRSLWILLGSMPDMPGDKYQEYLNFCAYNGKEMECQRLADFEASNGFLGMGGHEAHPYLEFSKPYHWGALKNQFFAAIFTPQTPAIGCLSFPRVQEGRSFMQGFLQMEITQSPMTISATYYVGPKQYLLLEKMGQHQDELMQFGFFSAFSKVLLLSMQGIHSFIPNWGWTIVILTVIIKLLMWPVTQMQLRSSQKMSSLQEPLKKLKEKYKDNPKKMQEETMKLFKECHINPASGCLPMLIQIPIFIGLYYMLRSASEIRFQPFLWVKDLSVPDTVGYLGSIPINIMPLLMGVTMVLQMKITPMPSTDGSQQKILMLMPFIFLFFCYNFPSALVLYWTVQNLFTIFQNKLTYRKKPIASIGSEQKR
ncbi:MAG: membrane protein insertase YidC [Opitutales bacterium]|nr:membrane protein insertase YidC [Opitutales bacterium]